MAYNASLLERRTNKQLFLLGHFLDVFTYPKPQGKSNPEIKVLRQIWLAH